MKYKKLGHSDLNVSSLSLGTWVFGGEMWGGSKEQGCIDAVTAALDQGVNLIDTAPIYGDGVSETLVGKAIRGRRDQVLIATKCGLVKNNGRITNDLTAPSIESEVDESLRRLQTDYIDLYQCHWPDPQTSIEETMAALNRLKEQGKIRYIGVSNFDLPLLKKALKEAEIVSVQMHYSILERSIEGEILPFCQEHEIGVLTYGALGGGVLTGKYAAPGRFKGADARSFFYKFYQGDAFNKILKLLDDFKAMNHPCNQAALNWVRQQMGVTSPLVGCRDAAQAKDNFAASGWELSENELQKLNVFRL